MGSSPAENGLSLCQEFAVDNMVAVRIIPGGIVTASKPPVASAAAEFLSKSVELTIQVRLSLTCSSLIVFEIRKVTVIVACGIVYSMLLGLAFTSLASRYGIFSSARKRIHAKAGE